MPQWTAPARHTYPASRADLARRCGVSARTLEKWPDDHPALRRTKSGRYSTRTFCKEMERAAREREAERELAGAVGGGGTTADEIAKAELEWKTNRARIADYTLRSLLREVVTTESVGRALADVGSAVVGALKGLPRRLAGRLAGLEEGAAVRVIEGELREVMERVREALRVVRFERPAVSVLGAKKGEGREVTIEERPKDEGRGTKGKRKRRVRKAIKRPSGRGKRGNVT